MNAVWIIPVVVIGVAVVIYLGVLAAREERKRREALAALAAELGLTFDPSRTPGLDDEYPQFGVFRRGHSRAAYNTLRGSVSIDGRGWPLRMGDYTYKITTSNGKTTTTRTYNLSYLIAAVPFPAVPDLSVRREGFMDKIAGALGFDDIDFESAEFSRKFFVKSTDRKFAYAVLHPRMMEFLLDGDPPSIELARGSVCIVDGTSRWDPARFRGRVDWMKSFFDLWPDYLTKELESR